MDSRLEVTSEILVMIKVELKSSIPVLRRGKEWFIQLQGRSARMSTSRVTLISCQSIEVGGTE